MEGPSLDVRVRGDGFTKVVGEATRGIAHVFGFSVGCGLELWSKPLILCGLELWSNGGCCPTARGVRVVEPKKITKIREGPKSLWTKPSPSHPHWGFFGVSGDLGAECQFRPENR